MIEINIPLLDLTRQYQALKPDLEKAVLDVLASSHYILGENVACFEKEFADYIGTKYAISVANGTDALVITLEALGIGAGDEVITTPYTFFATVEAIAAVGARLVFADIREDTLNIDERLLERLITKKTRAILPVHVFGLCSNMDEINAIAEKHGLSVIEDACQAAGAAYKGKKAGNLSDVSCFSFFPTKNLGCAGDGGMICTNNEETAVICRALRMHGSGAAGKRASQLIGRKEISGPDMESGEGGALYGRDKYYNYIFAHNSRLDELQAAILRVKMPHLDEYVRLRGEHARFYSESFKDLDFTLPYGDESVLHAYHLYTLRSGNRDEICAKLKEHGVATGIYYPIPLHLQKACERFGYKPGDMPVAEKVAGQAFSIPLFPEMTLREQEFISDQVKEAAANG